MTFLAFVGLFQYLMDFLVSCKANSTIKCQIFAKKMFCRTLIKIQQRSPSVTGRLEPTHLTQLSSSLINSALTLSATLSFFLKKKIKTLWIWENYLKALGDLLARTTGKNHWGELTTGKTTAAFLASTLDTKNFFCPCNYRLGVASGPQQQSSPAVFTSSPSAILASDPR